MSARAFRSVMISTTWKAGDGSVRYLSCIGIGGTAMGVVRDTSAYCSYQYEESPRCFDNTSRQTGRLFGTREDALSYAEMRASSLRVESS